MLTKKQIGILRNIIKHSKRVEEKAIGISRSTFDSDLDIREIICFNIFQIGELVKKFDPDFLHKYNAVPWKDIKGMRDWVGHGYNTIDWDDIWDTATNDITALKEYCEQILSENK